MTRRDRARKSGGGLWRRVVEDVKQGKVPGQRRLLREAQFLRTRGITLFAPPTQPRSPEEHVFVLWSNALAEANRILLDIERQFVILDVVRVQWGESDFSTNLTRFYGGLLPPNAEKETHCGTDPFLVVVVRDPHPFYAPRRTPKGVVNARTFDAKQRYRAWTGGGHRIHSSLDRGEADRDLFLLLGRRREDYRGADAWDRVIKSRFSNVVGAGAWRSPLELLTAIEVTSPYVQLYDFNGLPGSLETASASEQRLTVLLEARSRALVTVTGLATGGNGTSSPLNTTVAGRPTALELRQVGEGYFDPAWERALLRQRVRNAKGAFVPAWPDEFYTLLYHALIHDGSRFSAYKGLLASLAAQDDTLPSGEYGDATHARIVLDRYLRQQGYRCVVPSEAHESAAAAAK